MVPEGSSTTENGNRPNHFSRVHVPQQHALETAGRPRHQIHTAPEESRQGFLHRPVGATSLGSCRHPNASVLSVLTDNLAARGTRGHRHGEDDSARMVPDHQVRRRSVGIGQTSPPTGDLRSLGCHIRPWITQPDYRSRARRNRSGRQVPNGRPAEFAKLPWQLVRTGGTGLPGTR